MQYNQKIQKVNGVYLLLYFIVPVIPGAVLILLSLLVPEKEGPFAASAMMLLFLAFLWWCMGWQLVLKMKRKGMEKQLDAQGFVRNHTFNGDKSTIVIDAQHGDMALLFCFNPSVIQIASMQKITRAWVDDGAHGSGIMRGSSYVRFCFEIDGVTVKVNTFTSNKRWRMDSNYILTGISKADMMVNVINSAKQGQPMGQ
ncbi:MAG: hypothetical protein NC254_05625 [bacterium]|nr:hypothetical protein [bacterium]